MVNGAHYKSEYEAAKILGFHINGLRRRLKSSTFPDYISKHHPKEKRRVIVPCSVAGVDYKSVGSAARDLKVRYDEMKRRLASTDYPDYVCDKYPKKPTKVFKYEVRGEKYKTMREIADVEGLSRGRIQQKIKSSKYPEYRKI